LYNCDLDAHKSVPLVEGDDESKILTKFRPQFSEYRSTIGAWAILWPVYLLKDLTVDLLRNLLEMMRGTFQREADKQFS